MSWKSPSPSTIENKGLPYIPSEAFADFTLMTSLQSFSVPDVAHTNNPLPQLDSLMETASHILIPGHSIVSSR